MKEATLAGHFRPGCTSVRHPATTPFDQPARLHSRGHQIEFAPLLQSRFPENATLSSRLEIPAISGIFVPLGSIRPHFP
jgi:hypothetical protein